MDEANRRRKVSCLAEKCSCGECSFAALSSFNQYEDGCRSIQKLDHQAFGCEHVSTPANYSELKRKRASRIKDKGLRLLSLIVCNKLESKGRTTYNEIADEITAEFATEIGNATSVDEGHEKNDEKNIRRRVYDALNVLMAMNIITKEKKEILWRGLPNRTMEDMDELKVYIKGYRMELENSVATKAAYLNDLEEQIADLQNLKLRNEQLLKHRKAPIEAISLPFILIQTSAHATVEIEICEKMKLAHLDFDSTPFILYDDAEILRLMRHNQLQKE